MTEQSDEIITSKEQAVRVKADLMADEPVKKWRPFLSSNPDVAAALANLVPAQGAGEAVFSVKDDGRVDVFLFF